MNILSTFFYISLIFIYESESVQKTEEENQKNVANQKLDLTEDLGFIFYSIYNKQNGIYINITDNKNISSSYFSPNKDTYFIFHGWRDTVSSSTVLNTKDALLENHNINIFVVYWDGVANELYVTAIEKLGKLSDSLASLIKKFVLVGKLNLDKTTFVGHSLGAHLSGQTGLLLKAQIGTIIGLDPAGILYDLNKWPSLNQSSAKFVQVIHTGGNGFGTLEPLGHADYYPNGGKNQPMCGILDLNCSHLQVLAYYVESVKTGNFVSKKCDNYEKFKNNNCVPNGNSIMGGFSVDKKARGVYFLDTNMEAPYAKENENLY